MSVGAGEGRWSENDCMIAQGGLTTRKIGLKVEGTGNGHHGNMGSSLS